MTVQCCQRKSKFSRDTTHHVWVIFNSELGFRIRDQTSGFSYATIKIIRSTCRCPRSGCHRGSRCGSTGDARRRCSGINDFGWVRSWNDRHSRYRRCDARRSFDCLKCGIAFQHGSCFCCYFSTLFGKVFGIQHLEIRKEVYRFA